MKKNLMQPSTLLLLAVLAGTSIDAQKKKLSKELFAPTTTKKVAFVPYKVTDFTKDSKAATQLITLPNNKKIKLSDYVNNLNKLEANLAELGFDKNRTQKTIIASRFKKADFSKAPVTTTLLPKAAARPANLIIASKFVSKKLTDKVIISDRLTEAVLSLREGEVNALPNEKFDRTHRVTPPEFSNGDYGATLDVTYYLKGEVDPFFIKKNQLKNDSIARIIKETTSFFTAGMNITVMADVPEIGRVTAYKLEAEYTARSNKTKKHSSKTKLTVLQQVLINENNQNRAGDASTYKENRLQNISRLIGAADVFTYGLNLLMPVDFYMSASSIGADIDVEMTRTGITGSMGPRAAQSIFLETSYTEVIGPFGEGISSMVDVGVGGELRIIEGGFDYGFSAGLTVNNNRLFFINDMQGEVDVELLRGRLFTFYQYPLYVCEGILGLATPTCWEIRRVENDLFNTGAALKFERTVINEDKTAAVKW